MNLIHISSVALVLVSFGSSRLQAQHAEPASAVPEDQPAVTTSLAGGIVLGPGDTIRITSLSSDEISKEWRVGESGTLHLPLVGAVAVAGKTASALEAELEAAYSDYLIDPKIDVFVSELRSRPVTIVGAVGKPGTHQINGPASLFHMLQQAGGITAEGSRILIIRDTKWGLDGLPRAKLLSGGKAEAELSIDEVLKGHGPQAQTPIRPFDVINVEPKRERLIYIAGEVNRPGAIQLEIADGVSLTKALALAGGYKASGAHKQSYLWRGDRANESSIEINLHDIVRGKAEDVMLREGDYLIVPPKGAGFGSARDIMTLSQVATSAIFILSRL